MRSASVHSRALCALMLALLLGLRLIGSTGYMPSVDHGRIAIVVCPDADINAPFAPAAGHHHHHGGSKHEHGTCPYAAAAALGSLGADFGLLLAAVAFLAVALLLGRALVLPVRDALRIRPPSRGPPLPA